MSLVIWCDTSPSSMSTSSSSPPILSHNENTQYIPHGSKLPRSRSCAIKNHSGVKTCQSGGNPRTTTPTGYEPKELSTVSRIEAYAGDPYQLDEYRKKLEKKITELLSLKKWRDLEKWRQLVCRILNHQRRPTSNRTYTSTIPQKALQILISKMESNRRCCRRHLYAQKASGKPDAMVMQDRGKCTIHSSRSKGKFDVSFI